MSDEREIAAAVEPAGGTAAWRLIIFAVVLGVVGAVSGLVFLAITGLGADWYGDPGLGWFEGQVWWLAVAIGAGVLVGILRRVLRMPDDIPGLIEALRAEHVEPRMVPSIVAVSAVSLIGGASLGPEVALGQMGGGAAELIADRRGLDEGETKSLALSGMAGAFGGLFSSPLLAMILVLEIARPAGERYQQAFYGTLIASSVSFGLYFVIVGSVFLGIYDVPAYDFEDWHLLAGIGLGVLAAVVALITVVVGRATGAVFSRLPAPAGVKPVIAGAVFGLVGIALPLTNFTGSDQLNVVLQNAGALGVGLLIGILVGKMVAFAASTAGGFIGGPIFPILFIGGTAGVIVNQLVPDIPLGLAFSCMLAAVPGSIVSAPFSMVLLAGLLTQVGALETAPILIAVGTAYVVILIVQRVAGRRGAAASQTAGQD